MTQIDPSSPENVFERLRPVAENAAQWTYHRHRRRFNPGFDRDDATQEGLLKLWLLIRSGDVPAPGLVAVAARNRIKDVAKRPRPTVVLTEAVPVPEPPPDQVAAREWLDTVYPQAPATVRAYLEARIAGCSAKQFPDRTVRAWAAKWLRDHDWRDS